MHRTKTSWSKLIGGGIAVAMLPAAVAIAQGNLIDGPTLLAPGEAARYQITVAGDEQRDACNVRLAVELPEGFDRRGELPGAVFEPASRVLTFTPRPTLAAGAAALYEVALSAPPHPVERAVMCARLSYDTCVGSSPQPIAAEACIEMRVEPTTAAEPGPRPQWPIPCSLALPVIDGRISAGEYDVAAVTSRERGDKPDVLRAPKTVTMYAFHNFTTLYVAIDFDDSPDDKLDHNDQDEVNLVIDANNNAGNTPDIADRMYLIKRILNERENFVGKGDNMDGGKWDDIVGSIASAAVAERAGGWVAEFAIPFADLGGVAPGDTIGIGYGLHAHPDPDHWTTWPWFKDDKEDTEHPEVWAESLLDLCGPVADFTTAAVCQGQAMEFVDTSINDPDFWTWEFGVTPRVTSTDQNPTFVYPAPGIYDVTLLCCNALGCTNTVKQVEVFELPSVVFAPGPWPLPTACIDPTLPTQLTLVESSTPGLGATISDWRWSTTVGTLDTTSAPVVLDVPAGIADDPDVTLEVEDTHGCVASLTQPLILNAPPDAALAVAPPRACTSPAPVFALDAGATTPGDGALIDFGFSSSLGSTLSNPSDMTLGTIQMPPMFTGTQTVAVQAQDDLGCADSAAFDFTVDPLPVPDLVVTPGQTCTDDVAEIAVDLDARGYNSAAGMNSFAWSADAGALDSMAGDRTTLRLGVGFFGPVTVDVVGQDALGCAAPAQETFTIHHGPLPALAVTVDPAGGPAVLERCTDPVAAMVIELDATATTSDGSLLDSGFGWTADAGTLVDIGGRKAELTLPAGFTGDVTVGLTVLDGNGCEREVEQTITIHGLPAADLTAPFAAACSDPDGPIIVALDARGSSPDGGTPIVDWQWTVPGGHGRTGSGAQVDWLIPASLTGLKQARVRVVDGHGCSDEATFDVAVWRLPEAAFEFASSRVCTDETADVIVSLDASATVPGDGALGPAGYRWTADAGVIVGTGAAPSLQLPPGYAGTVEVCLELVDANGCGDALCHDVIVDPLPTPDIELVVAAQCTNPERDVVFTLDGRGSSSPAGIPATGYSWSSASGTLVDAAAALTELRLPPGFTGVVPISLQIEDGSSCVKQVDSAVEVYGLPEPDLVSAVPGVCSDPATAQTVSLSAAGSLPSGGAPIVAWNWTLPAGHTRIGSGAAIDWQLPAGTVGPQTATVRVRDGHGCRDQVGHTIDVWRLPQPVFDFGPTPGRVCTVPTIGAVVALDATASIPGDGALAASSYRWRTRAGAIVGSGPRPSLQLPPDYDGSVEVCLRIVDDNLCSTEICRELIVDPLPAPDIAIATAELCTDPAGEVVFELDGSGSASAAGIPAGGYRWSADTGTLTASGAVRTELRLPAGFVGTVPVRLEVEDGNGCVQSVESEVLVHALPLAAAQARPLTDACGGDPAGVTFAVDGSGTTFEGGASAVAWTWQFPRGHSSSGAGPVVDWTVPAGVTGIVRAGLTVTDTNGCVSVPRSFEVEVFAPPRVSLAADAAVCTVDDPDGLTLPLMARAEAGSAALAGYGWSSDAGTLSSSTSDTAALSLPAGHTGPVEVCVEVADDNACTDLRCRTIAVKGLPEPVFTVAAARPCTDDDDPIPVALDATATSSPNGLAAAGGAVWTASAGTLGGGGLTNGLSLPAGFSGPVDIELQVTDAAGCVQTVAERLEIAPGPAVVIAPLAGVCTDPGADLPIALDGSDSSGASALTYGWSSDIGVIDRPAVAQPILTLPRGYTGPVEVALEVSEGPGCDRTVTRSFDAHPLPEVALGADVVAMCSPEADTVVQLDAALSSSPAGIPPGGFAWSATAGTLSSTAGAKPTLTVPAGHVGPIEVKVSVTDGNGCGFARTETIDVTPAPVPVVAVDQQATCPDPRGVSFLFDGSGSTGVGGVQHRWRTSAGSLSSLDGANTVLTLPTNIGTATVTLIVTDPAGCRRSVEQTVTVRDGPEAIVEALTRNVCAESGDSAAVVLDAAASTGSGTSSIASYGWIFTGPGVIDSPGSARPTLTYPPGTTGTFTASVVVTDTEGCSDSATASFRIVEASPPVALVEADAELVCSSPGPIVVGLDAGASRAVPPAVLAGPGAFTWWVSGGGSLSGSGARRDLLTSGPGAATHEVFVRVTDSNGCDELVQTTVTLVAPPEAVIAADPERQCEGETGASFALAAGGSVSHHPSDPSLRYDWSASSGTVVDPTQAATELRLARTGVGRDVDVALVVEDALGCRSPAAGSRIRVDGAPDAAIAATPALAGYPSGFTGTGSDGTAPYTFAWDFGDGATATGVNPSHVFATPGSYPIRLALTDALGCTATAAQVVAIGQELLGTLSVGSGCVAEPIPLRASLTGGQPPYTFSWSYGDTTTGGTPGPSTAHAYALPGDKTVELTVRDSGAARQQSLVLRGLATVHPLPPLTVDSTGPEVAGLAQTFTAATDSGALVEWRFSDGARATGQFVEHVFTDAGPVSAMATARSPFGCEVEAGVEVDLVWPDSDVSIAKRVDRTEVEPGDTVGYRIEIASRGGAVSDVAVRDQLPAGFTLEPGSFTIDGALVAGAPSRGALIEFPSFDLAPGGLATIGYRVRVADDAVAGEHVNRAELFALDAAGRTLRAGPVTASVRVSAVEEPPAEGFVDLVVSKQADPDPDPAVAGGLVRYRIDFLNRGTLPATDVILTDAWPSDQASIALNGDAGVVLGSHIEWRIDSVPPGGTGTVQYTLQLDDDLASEAVVPNVVTIAGNEADPDPSSNRAATDVVIGGAPDLTLAKAVGTDPDPAESGAVASYTLSWTNAGTGRAPGAFIEDDYDETKIQIESLPAGASDSGGVIRFELGDLEPGASGSLTYTASVLDGATGAVENRAAIDSALSDVAPGDNTASVRFDIVVHPAVLSLTSVVDASRGCRIPQVELAIRSELFDTAQAMYAAAEMLDAAGRLDAAGERVDLSLGGTLPRLAGQLAAFGELNVRSLFLDSGMGMPWAPLDRPARYAATATPLGLASPHLPSAPVTVPFATAHPVFEPTRDLDEPWCRHELHRVTDPASLGQGLAAIAAFADHERRLGADAPPQHRFEARQLLTQAVAGIRLYAGWPGVEGTGELPARHQLPSDPAAGVSASAERAGVEPLAVLARGLARLIATCSSEAAPAPADCAAEARGLLTRALTELAGRHDAARGLLHDDGVVTAGAVAATAEAVRAARAAGVELPPALAEAASSGLRALAESGTGDVYAARLELASGVRGAPDLEAQLAALRAALALGETETADSIWRRLEADRLDTRLLVYRTGAADGSFDYRPSHIGGLVGAVSRLVGRTEPGRRTTLLERAARTVQLVAVDAGLQVGLVGRRAGSTFGPDSPQAGVRMLVGANGEVRVSALVAEAPHTLAPVLVDRVRFGGQTLHHRDRSMVGAARGVGPQAGELGYLAGRSGDCESARVERIDRRFGTETGLLAAGAMERTASVLAEHASARDDRLLGQFAAELAATARADRTTLAMLAGMGVPIRAAEPDGRGPEPGEVLARAVELAGLAAPPPGMRATWLELDAGDPVFAGPVDALDPYGQGWDVTRFERTVMPAALGQALWTDVAMARAGLAAQADPAERYTGLVRLYAATLKVELLARELRRGLGGWEVVQDAEGHLVELRPLGRAEDLRGRASVLRGLAAYRSLVESELGLPAGSLAAGIPLAEDPARRLSRRLLNDVERAIERGRETDPLALSYATHALLAMARIEPAEATEARSLAARAAAALGGATASVETSALAIAGLELEARAAAGASAEEIRTAYRGLRDRFLDRSWRLFRSTESGDEFVLRDIDVGATLLGLGAAMPHLLQSEAEEAADLVHGVVGRMLYETGLQQDHPVAIAAGPDTLRGAAAQISRAVRVSVVQTPSSGGAIFPDDIVRLTYRVENPVEASSADLVELDVAPGRAFRYLPGSLTVDGRPASDPRADDGGLRLALGRVGGGQVVEVGLLLTVADDAGAAEHPIVARVAGASMPGPEGQPIAAAPVSDAVRVERFGGVEGWVWLDWDGDGKKAEIEPGVGGVTVALDDGTAAVTDDAGRYSLLDLVPATYAVHLHPGSLPGQMDADRTERRERIESGVTTRADFALRAASVATGIVFRDFDGDRRRDADEPTVTGAVVEASSGQRAVTDRTGRYLIRGLPTGSLRLVVPRRQPYLRDADDLQVRPLPLPPPPEWSAELGRRAER